MMGALRAHLGNRAHPAGAHVSHVHGGGERDQGVVGADVGGRVLASNVLFARLEGQCVSAVFVMVQSSCPRGGPGCVSSALVSPP